MFFVAAVAIVNIPWHQELEFELPAEGSNGKQGLLGDADGDSPSDDDEPSDAVLRVSLSNGGELALRGRDVKVSRRKRGT